MFDVAIFLGFIKHITFSEFWSFKTPLLKSPYNVECTDNDEISLEVYILKQILLILTKMLIQKVCGKQKFSEI